MANYPSPLSVVIKGAIAGLAGTAALTAAMQRGPQLIEERFDVSMSPEQPPPPIGEEPPEEPTVELAGRVAEGVLERPIDEERKQTAGQAIHWSYGAMWGVIFGVLQTSLRPSTLLHGTIFGVLVGTVASTVVPAMGLAPPPTEQPRRMSAMQLGFHLLFGWVTALTYRLLTLRD